MRGPAWMLAMLLVLALPSTAGADHAQSSRSDRMLAAMVYRFKSYIYWPADSANPAPRNQFSVCVLGEAPFGGALHGLEEAGNAAVRHIEQPGAAAGCHVLVIGQSEQARLEKILDALEGSEIVTISDMKNFTDRGGMIRVFVRNNFVGFDINQDAMNQAGLDVDLRLIRLASSTRS